MTREEAITYLKVIWNRYKAEYEIERETLDAYHMAIEALRDKAVHGYTEWLEKIIVMLEPVCLCEDTTDKEWCEENCGHASIQAECLRHLYEVSKGGEDVANG